MLEAHIGCLPGVHTSCTTNLHINIAVCVSSASGEFKGFLGEAQSAHNEEVHPFSRDRLM